MRTTLDIDRALLIEAKELGGFRTFNETIIAALTFVVAERQRREASASRDVSTERERQSDRSPAE